MITAKNDTGSIMFYGSTEEGDSSTFVFHIPEYYDMFKLFDDKCWLIFIGIDMFSELYNTPSKGYKLTDIAVDSISFDDDEQTVGVDILLPKSLIPPVMARVKLDNLLRFVPSIVEDKIKLSLDERYIVKRLLAEPTIHHSLPVKAQHQLADGNSIIGVKPLKEYILSYYNENKQYFLQQPIENLYWDFMNRLLSTGKKGITIEEFIDCYSSFYTCNKVQFNGFVLHFFKPIQVVQKMNQSQVTKEE